MQALKGILRSARYSTVPNELGYCGPHGAYKELQRFIAGPNPESAAVAQKLLGQFTASYAYLKLIAEHNGLNPFDEDVVEAYWLGNSLLENVPYSALQKMLLGEFSKPGMLPERIARAKAESLPKGMLPHHSMHVLHINFLNPELKPLLQNLTACLVLWAEVRERTKNGLQVKTAKLLHESGQLKLGEHVHVIDAGFVQGAQKGDLLSLHWGKAIERIDSDRFKQLKDCTLRNLETLGAALKD